MYPVFQLFLSLQFHGIDLGRIEQGSHRTEIITLNSGATWIAGVLAQIYARYVVTTKQILWIAGIALKTLTY